MYSADFWLTNSGYSWRNPPPLIKILLVNYAHPERLMLFILVSERTCPLTGRCHWEIVRPMNAQSHIPPDHAAKREPVGPSYHLHQFPQHSFVGQNRMSLAQTRFWSIVRFPCLSKEVSIRTQKGYRPLRITSNWLRKTSAFQRDAIHTHG
jgi:hypothetical protein